MPPKQRSLFENVHEFHDAAAPHSEMSRFPKGPTMPSADARSHTMALITEEYSELTTGMLVDESIPDTADALIDLMYTSVAGLLHLGLTYEQMEILWEEVHMANMSKVDPSYGLLDDNDGKPYINAAGKITKPPGFVPPDIEGLINDFRKQATA